jgi:hypothetical protein
VDIWIVWIDKVGIMNEFHVCNLRRPFENCEFTPLLYRITKWTSKQLNTLRKSKFKLNRQYLENIYITFIRPILEYGSEVWDNCGAVNSDRLEKVHTEACSNSNRAYFIC